MMKTVVAFSVLILLYCRNVRSASQPHAKCERDFSKVGCFQQRKSSALTNVYLLNDRDTSSKYFTGYIIDWTNFKASIHSLACRCAQRARQKKLKYFAIRFWGECYGGNDEKLFALVKADKSASSVDCYGYDYKPCNALDKTECVGTDKTEYLFALKKGTTIGYSSPLKRKVICENESSKLSCPAGTRISNVKANYGRLSRAYCGPIGTFKRCKSISLSTVKVKKHCEGLQSCDLLASNSIFGDPCPGTSKYLQIVHRCSS